MTHTFPKSGGSPSWRALYPFISSALHRAKPDSSVVFAAIFLLRRLRTRYPSSKNWSRHRLFMSALMIASKVMCDNTYSNKSWAIIGQSLFTLQDLNRMEREMLHLLQWRIHLDSFQLYEFARCVCETFRHGIFHRHSTWFFDLTFSCLDIHEYELGKSREIGSVPQWV